MAGKLTRREALKGIGLTLGATALGFSGSGRDLSRTLEYSLGYDRVYEPLAGNSGRQLSAITCGAGSRGNTYGNYALSFPDQIRIVGVAEPVQIRNERYAKKHSIRDENRFNTWEQVFDRPKWADVILITMPDHLHYEPCLRALSMGYDVLLEKPMAQTAEQCREIDRMVTRTGRIVGVCHVLRYAPYFIRMHQLVNSGAIGDLVSVQHLEPIEHIHMSHSYVRGNWHSSRASTPIILAKSCHDLDILRWIIGKPCRQIAAMGDLKWFTRQNAPEGSTERCLGGCSVEKECPYSAAKVYAETRNWTYVFDLPEEKEKQTGAVMELLKTTNYGRCVYRMDNDQPDHYITSMMFDGNITAAFSMEAFTSYGGRRTRLMGAMGDLYGDMHELHLTDFRNNQTVRMVPAEEELWKYKNSGHGGGDWMLMRNFLEAVIQQDPAFLTTTVSQSLESHIMGFAAEESRKNGKVIRLKT